MMRCCPVLLALALLFGPASAAEAQVSFGVKAGVNIAGLEGTDVPDELESRTALVAGVLLHHPLSDLFALQPELLYSQKGFRVSEVFFGEPIDITGKIDYLEVPILLRLSVPTASPTLRPFLHIGPTFAVEIRCNVSFSGFGESGTEDCEEPGEFDEEVGERRKFDVGLGLGGGLELAMGSGALLLEARYTRGLTSLDKSEDDLDVKNRALSFSVGYQFR